MTKYSKPVKPVKSSNIAVKVETLKYTQEDIKKATVMYCCNYINDYLYAGSDGIKANSPEDLVTFAIVNIRGRVEDFVTHSALERNANWRTCSVLELYNKLATLNDLVNEEDSSIEDQFPELEGDCFYVVIRAEVSEEVTDLVVGLDKKAWDLANAKCENPLQPVNSVLVSSLLENAKKERIRLEKELAIKRANKEKRILEAKALLKKELGVDLDELLR
jgi:hypothetical protein